MITPKINALFQFIDYLHNNIERLNQYNYLIEELELLRIERNQLRPENNYKDKQKYDKIQSELENKFQFLQDNTASPIRAKAIELNICSFGNSPITYFNGSEAEIRRLKESFSEEDLPEIFKHKTLYLEYRSQTHRTFLSLELFFKDLDRLLKELFDFFKEDIELNEFQEFETKAIEAKSIEEAAIGILQGYKNFTLPINFLMPSLNQSEGNFAPQQLFPLEKQELRESLKRENGDTIERLDQLFEHTSKYFAIMQILVSQKLIEPNTYIWKDTTKGNRAFLASIIKELHAKGYYKDKMSPENNTIELICRNTFQWKVGIDTIKRAKPSRFDLSFIPPASTI